MMRSPDHAPTDLRPRQLLLLAAAVFVVSAGYGALLPLLPAWLGQQMPQAGAAEVARHVGFLSGAYAAGVLAGAPLWGLVADRLGHPRVLIGGLLGYVASLLLLLTPASSALWAIYALRAAAGLFVAAVVPMVPALVAAHTPPALRARRFAWLGSAALLGFLFGPALNAVADGLVAWADGGAVRAPLSAAIVIGLSAALAAGTMAGLARSLPAREAPLAHTHAGSAGQERADVMDLLWLSGAIMFVLSGFELGIVLQGQEHPALSTQEIALMFAECSLVMLGIDALLFFTSLLDKAPPRVLIVAGLLLGMSGLAALAVHRADAWMYLGVSLVSAGTGLVLPVISFLAAGAARRKLGVIMGALAAAAGLGQTVGSAAGGWLFGTTAQLGFAWLMLPLALTLVLLLVRPSWCARAKPRHARTRTPRSASGMVEEASE